MTKSLYALLLVLPVSVVARTVGSTSNHDSSLLRIPSANYSAILARRILNLSKLGTLSTVFPPDNDLHHHHLGDAVVSGSADSLAGVPIGLPDYFADCDPDGTGNPTILAIDIATSFRNVRSGSNISLAVQWTPPYPPSKRISALSWLSSVFAAAAGDSPDPMPYSAANLPRFSLIGHLEPLDHGDADYDALAECFVTKHPDARYWLPGNKVHRAEWARLVVTRIYWVGGFGDRAYIGWIPVESYRAVTREQWQAATLLGEQPNWHEWRSMADEL